MPRLHLVRHGRAAAGWHQDLDPGLDSVGHAQASAVATLLAPLGPLPMIVSPLRRTRETAVPFERLWGAPARIEPKVAEIVSPTQDLAARAAWLGVVVRQNWSEVDNLSLHRWREGVLQALLSLDRDTVVITHYIVINAAVGHATADDRVVCFQPGNCSRTILEVAGGTLSLVALGEEAVAQVG